MSEAPPVVESDQRFAPLFRLRPPSRFDPALTAGPDHPGLGRLRALARGAGSVLLLLSIGLCAACTPKIELLPSASALDPSQPVDLERPMPVPLASGHLSTAWAIDFAPGGRRLYTAGDDKVVRIWDVDSRKQVGVLRVPQWFGLDGEIWAIDVSPDGRHLAIGGCQACSGLWPAKDAHLLHLADLESMEIVASAPIGATAHSVAFSPDGRLLATGGYDGRLHLFRVEEGGALVEEAVLPGHGARIVGISWFADRSGLATIGRDGLLVRWSPHPAGGWFAEWYVQNEPDLAAVAVSPEGDWIALGTRGGLLTLHDPDDGKKLQTLLQLEDVQIESIVVASDGASLAYGTGSKKDDHRGVGILTLPEGVELSFQKVESAIYGLAWHEGDPGVLAVLEGYLGSVLLFDPNGLGEIGRLSGAPPVLTRVYTKEDGVAWRTWGSEELSETVFDTRSLALQDRDPEHKYLNYGIQRVSLLDVNQPSPGMITMRRKPHDATWVVPVSESRISSWSVLDERWIGLGAGTKLILIDSFDAGQRRRICHGHSAVVSGVAPHGAGPERVVTASADRTIRFWNKESCELLMTFLPGEESEWVAWTPGGLFAASEKGSSLVGFQVNRGARQTPRVIPSDRFPERRRPDLIRRILERGSAQGLDENTPPEAKGP